MILWFFSFSARERNNKTELNLRRNSPKMLPQRDLDILREAATKISVFNAIKYPKILPGLKNARTREICGYLHLLLLWLRHPGRNTKLPSLHNLQLFPVLPPPKYHPHPVHFRSGSCHAATRSRSAPSLAGDELC